MKNQFFKKLSFVLAIAMVLSIIAPFASAFAAAKPSLNSTKKYLHLDVPKLNEFDFNIRNKQSGWKYNWTSANTKVATVNARNGITTAQGVGTTKVYVDITDRDGKNVARLTANVIVRDNIQTVKISNGPKDDKLNVNEEFDYNRSFVTRSGSKTKTSAITRWTVEPSENATIDDKGIFKATKAGEYTIVARAFQSNARYQSWLKDPVKYANYVLATDSKKVTVGVAMEKVEQVNSDTLRVTFTSPVEDVAKNITVSYLAGTTPIRQVVKEVKMNDDKTVATVQMYVPFTEKTVYVVAFPEMDTVQFAAATRNWEDVADLRVTTTTANIGEETEVKVALYNKDGVDITTTALLNRVTLTSSSDRVYFNAGKVTIFNKGDNTTITATFNTYNYDPTTGNQIGVITRTGVITGVEKAAVTVGNLAAWTIAKVNGSNVNWNSVNHTIAAEDGDVRLFVRARKSDNQTFAASNETAEAGKFTYTSSNSDVLIVLADGTLFPVRQGQAVVVVSYEGKIIDTVTVTIGAKRAASQFIIDATQFALSNAASVQDQKKIKLEVKDQYGVNVPLNNVSITAMAGTPAHNLISGTVGSTSNEITFNATGATAGLYTYSVKANGLTRVVQVNVQAPQDNTTAYYRLDLNNTNFNTLLGGNDNITSVNLNVTIFGYASNNVKNERRAVAGQGFKVEITGPNNFSTELTAASNGVFNLARTVDGAPIERIANGEYRIRLIGTENNQVHDIRTFTVTNTQPAPTVTVKKLVTSQTTILAAVKDCLEVKMGDTTVTADITLADDSILGTGRTVFVRNVRYRQYIAGTTSYIDHTVPVNQTITY